MFSWIQKMRHITFFRRNLCFAYFTLIYCGLLSLLQPAVAAIVITTGDNQQIPVGSPSTEIFFQVIDDIGNPNTTITFSLTNPAGLTTTDGLSNTVVHPDDSGLVSTHFNGTDIIGNYTITATLATDATQSAKANIVVVAQETFSQLPDLGAGMAVKPSWETVETNSSFNGGIQVNDGEFSQNTLLTPNDSVIIRGVINVDSTHIGMPADILVVGGYTAFDFPEVFVMIDGKNVMYNWDGHLTNLVAFARVNHLPKQQPVNMYGGKLPLGQVRAWFGYRLDNGLIVFNGSKSIDAQITEFLPSPIPPEPEPPISPEPPIELTISGNPDSVAYYMDSDGNAPKFEYYFAPRITKANRDDIVSFTIENKPHWATFDEKTGIFRGVPSENDEGLYEAITITVNDGIETQSLTPFEIEVEQWSGYGFCTAENHENTIMGSPISDTLATQNQCESWATAQRLKADTAEIHIDESQDELESLADDISDIREPTYDPSSQTCPAGYLVVEQNSGEPRCMEDLTDEEIVQRIEKTMVRDLDNYLTDMEFEAIPDFTPLQPVLSEPDANGHRTLTLPPPVSIQNTLEKQRRKMDLESELGDLGILTDCSALIDQGSGWNRSVCFSWNKTLGDNQFGASADAMAYLRVSGDASASFSITGRLFGNSEKIVNLFSKTQIYTLPDEVIEVANQIEDAAQVIGQATEVIEQAANQDPDETLKAILERPELQAQFEGVIDQAIIEALRQAQAEFEKAKAQIDEAVGQTQAAIAEAKAQFEAAKADLEAVKQQFNEAKALAQNALQTLSVDKTGFIAEFQIAGQTIDSYVKEAQAGEPLAFEKEWQEDISLLSIKQNFAVGPIPVTVGASLTARPSITLSGGIQNPLDKNNATAIVSVTPELDVAVNAEGGVGSQLIAEVGVSTELTLVDTDVEFSLLAQAKDFPEKPPLIIVDWAADLLKGSVSLYAQISETIMKVVNAPAKLINWFSKLVGGPKLIPELKISRYEKKLFDWEGYHYPDEQACQILKPGREIIYCSRPDECYRCSENPVLLDEVANVLDEIGNPITGSPFELEFETYEE